MNLSVMAARATRKTLRWSNKLTSFGDDRPWTNYDCDGIPHNMTFTQVLGLPYRLSVTMTTHGMFQTETFYSLKDQGSGARTRSQTIVLLDSEGDPIVAMSIN